MMREPSPAQPLRLDLKVRLAPPARCPAPRTPRTPPHGAGRSLSVGGARSQKKVSARTSKVKAVDFHPTEPWVLATTYTGQAMIWDHAAGTIIKTFEVCDLPVRAAKFIARKGWFATGSDDLMIRVFNYNTMEKVTAFEAHIDFIRYLEVHPTQPYMLSCSDEGVIKLWDWEKAWANTQAFDGHSNYVMMVRFNPKDPMLFASASLDRTVKMWGLGSPDPHFTLEGHTRGVNCVAFFPGGDKPYLVSGGDDAVVKVWDYQTKSCLQTLEGHADNVVAVAFHSQLPLLLSASEDGSLRIWHSSTYRLENSLSYGMDKAWALDVAAGSNDVVVGYDEGLVVVKLGSERPVSSMDRNGKIVWANNTEIQTATVKGAADAVSASDGEKLSLSPRDLGSCDVFPQQLKHNANGRFVAVCGDGEFIIYTAQVLRNKAFGAALDFGWSATGTGDYAVRESTSTVRVYKGFKEHRAFRPDVRGDALFGGRLFAVRDSDSVCFYDWDQCVLVRKIDVAPRDVQWNDQGTLVALIVDDTFFVLRYNAGHVAEALAAGDLPEDGVDSAFELEHEVAESVQTGQWVGDCFLFTSASRLNYCVGGEVQTLAHLDRPLYLLGHVAREDRVFLMDKDRCVVSYRLRASVLEYQTAVVRGDFEAANAILPRVPESEYNNIARFLESQGFKEEAMEVSCDPEQRYSLAIQLNKLEAAHQMLLAMEADEESAEAQQKWRQLGDIAQRRGDLVMAKRCAEKGADLAGLLLFASCEGDAEAMRDVAARAREAGKNNVAFLALLLLQDVQGCTDLLCDTDRVPEAAFFARTYCPAEVDRVVARWRQELSAVSTRAAEALASPSQYANLFPGYELALRIDKQLQSARAAGLRPAKEYPQAHGEMEMDLLALARENGGELPADLPQLAILAQAAAPPSPAKPASPTKTAPAPEQQEQEAEAEADVGAEASSAPAPAAAGAASPAASPRRTERRASPAKPAEPAPAPAPAPSSPAPSSPPKASQGGGTAPAASPEQVEVAAEPEGAGEGEGGDEDFDDDFAELGDDDDNFGFAMGSE